MTCQAIASHMSNLEEANCRDVESGKQSLSARAAVPGVRARVAPGRRLGQPAEVMGPAVRMAGAARHWAGRCGSGAAAFRPAARSGRSRPGSTHSASCPDCLGEPCCLRVINTACYCSLSYSFDGFIDGEKRDEKPLSRDDRLPEPVFYFDV